MTIPGINFSMFEPKGIGRTTQFVTFDPMRAGMYISKKMQKIQ